MTPSDSARRPADDPHVVDETIQRGAPAPESSTRPADDVPAEETLVRERPADDDAIEGTMVRDSPAHGVAGDETLVRQPQPGQTPQGPAQDDDVERTLLRKKPPAQPSPPGNPQFDDLLTGGSQYERYDVKGEIGRGGMGVVLEAWDKGLRRTLAMKRLRSTVDVRKVHASSAEDRDLLSRFFDEAQITGQLEHPGIVPVHEIGYDAEGGVYFTMRRVRGRELKEIFAHVREGDGWTVTRALGVIQRVCETMAFAHSKGVVHRDLKPSNIMIGRFGATYVMDWGLAKVVGQRGRVDEEAFAQSMVGSHRNELKSTSESSFATMHGAIVGTACYMPPEQARGEIDRVGPRSDVYAVGAMLYELLTGRRPYTGEGYSGTLNDILQALSEGPPTPIHEIKPSVPTELVAICEKAMAREIDERYADMQVMSEDLRAYLEGRVVRAYNAGIITIMRKWIARNRATAAAISVSVLLVIAGASAFVWQQGRTIRAVQEERDRTAVARDDAIASSYVANIIAADVSLRSGEVRDARHRLDQCPPALRGWEWLHLNLQTDTSLQTLTIGTGVTAVSVSANGARFATGAFDGGVRVWDADSGELRATLEGHDGAVTSLAFHPASSLLVTAAADETAILWDVGLGEAVQVITGHEASVTSVAWSPDGERVLTGSADETVRVWDPATGAVLETYPFPDQTVAAVAYVADGGSIVVVSADGRVIHIDASSGEELLSFNVEDTEISSLTTDRMSALAVFGCKDGSVRLVNLASGQESRLFASAPVHTTALTPDGRRLIAGTNDGSLWTWDLETREVVDIARGHEGFVSAVAVTPDGARYLSGSVDGTARVWSTQGGFVERTLTGPEELVLSVASSPDGSRIAAGCAYGGAIQVWDTRTGAPLLLFPGQDDPVSALAYGPDGTWLAIGTRDLSEVRIIDAATGELRVGPLAGHETSITAIAVNAEGTRLASSSRDGTVRVWDARTGKSLLTFDEHLESVASVDFAPDGQSVVSGSADGRVLVWDTTTGTIQHAIEHPAGAVHSVAFHPDGERIAFGGADGSLHSARLGVESEPLELTGHAGTVLTLAFFPDGRRLASGSFDNSVRVWDVASGELMLTLRGHNLPVTSVAVGENGERVISGSFDNTVRLWESRPARR